MIIDIDTNSTGEVVFVPTNGDAYELLNMLFEAGLHKDVSIIDHGAIIFEKQLTRSNNCV